jgi:multiple sugar transport system ATP-binding protein
MATLQLQNVCKRYGAVAVIQDLSLEIADGEFIVFVGPSGCGKSTLIRMIAGLEEINSGALLIDGQRMNEVGPADRGLAMVFQSYALYPHMTVRKNMSFALRLARVPRAERDRKVAEVARILHLENYLDHKPGQLSGGQRQRVAIGRAIVRNPRIFLFDEPLSNLDAALRGQMRGELARLHEEIDATMIYVTHDQVEAMTMADRIVVLQAGHIEQVGTPLEIYRRPVNLFVAGFMGSPPMNQLPAQIVGFNESGVRVGLAGNVAVPVAVNSQAIKLNDRVTLGVRPEGLRLTAAAAVPNAAAKTGSAAETGSAASGGPLSGTTHLVERLGSISLVHIDLDHGGRVIAQVGATEDIRPRQHVSLTIDPVHCHVFDETGRALVPIA